jgi:hypothetical protein
MGVHPAGNRGSFSYDWSLPSLSRLRDGTHLLAVGPVNPGHLPRPGRSAGCAGGCPNLGPGRRIVIKTARHGVIRIAGQAGSQARQLRPDHSRTTEAGLCRTHHPSSLPNIRSSVVQQAQRYASADPPLRRAGHLSKLAWELPLTADWYLHLYADPCYVSRPAAPSGYAFSARPAGMRALPAGSANR